MFFKNFGIMKGKVSQTNKVAHRWLLENPMSIKYYILSAEGHWISAGNSFYLSYIFSIAVMFSS